MNKWILAAALVLCALGWARAEDGKTEEKEKRLTIEERVEKLEAEQVSAKRDIVKFADLVVNGLLKIRREMLEDILSLRQTDIAAIQMSKARLDAIRAVEDRATALQSRLAALEARAVSEAGLPAPVIGRPPAPPAPADLVTDALQPPDERNAGALLDCSYAASRIEDDKTLSAQQRRAKISALKWHWGYLAVRVTSTKRKDGVAVLRLERETFDARSGARAGSLPRLLTFLIGDGRDHGRGAAFEVGAPYYAPIPEGAADSARVGSVVVLRVDWVAGRTPAFRFTYVSHHPAKAGK